ncbi:VTT domain-containing protein [Halogeometricum sp. CBA1124]|uniref:VTT domain-containing protein n=1 Tax=Halogeometricum sp. CBA1124 TaxID=2668071 RepID=UPI00142A0302|nr:VTT domain-containing protein [Halogeometricum sp. CBA1124]MUV58266.1 TVP38/TMEM64 family protein [Halogeometricum sp. CBA1124]
MRLFASAAARRSALRGLGLLALCLLLGGVAVRAYAPFVLDPAWVRATVGGLGPYAAPAFVLVQAAQVIVAPIPGQTLGVVGLFVVFLLPTFPDDAICALAGLTTLRFRTFVALVAVGRLPTFVLVALVGDGVAAGRTTTALGALAAVALLSAAVYVARDRFGSAGSVADDAG